MNEPTVNCDVVIMPDAHVAGAAISASQALAKCGSQFTLQDGTYYPHISLYMLKLAINNVPQVMQLLEALAQSFRPFMLQAERIDEGARYVMVEYAVPDALRTMQEAVLAAISPLHRGIMDKDDDNVRQSTGLALKNYQVYGYKYIGEFFHPHITLTRIHDAASGYEHLLPSVENFTGTFPMLGLFELGENNTCIHKLAAWPLSARP